MRSIGSGPSSQAAQYAAPIITAADVALGGAAALTGAGILGSIYGAYDLATRGADLLPSSSSQYGSGMYPNPPGDDEVQEYQGFTLVWSWILWNKTRF